VELDIAWALSSLKTEPRNKTSRAESKASRSAPHSTSVAEPVVASTKNAPAGVQSWGKFCHQLWVDVFSISLASDGTRTVVCVGHETTINYLHCIQKRKTKHSDVTCGDSYRFATMVFARNLTTASKQGAEGHGRNRFDILSRKSDETEEKPTKVPVTSYV
jgi:hypothetical protein